MDLDDVRERLAEEGPQATPQELERARKRALMGHRRATQRSRRMRSRIVTLVAVAGLTVGTGGVFSMAGGASGNDNGSAKSLYCPPSSPMGGIEKARGSGSLREVGHRWFPGPLRSAPGPAVQVLKRFSKESPGSRVSGV